MPSNKTKFRTGQVPVTPQIASTDLNLRDFRCGEGTQKLT
jgi:hypothetical protein